MMLRGNPLVLPATAHHLGSVAKATGQVYSSAIRKENKFVFLYGCFSNPRYVDFIYKIY